MDAALRPLMIFILIVVISSFNPCFDGCRPATIEIFKFLSFSFVVSILVLMDAALRL